VDAFVPEGLEVTAGPAPVPLVPGATALNLPISARFLYGAPGAGLAGNAELRLLPDPEPFEAWRGWRFGLQDENFAPDLITQEIAPLDREGRGVVALTLPRAPDTTLPIKANVTLAIAEPGGRESRARIAVPVRAASLFPVLRPAFQGDAVDAGAEAAFDIAAVAPDGSAASARLRLRLMRERPDWRLVMRDSIARFETVWRDEPVDAAEITINPAAPARFARSLPFGRYRLEIADADGLGMASYRFRAGWAGVESAEIPDRIDVAAERRNFAPGEVARLRITPPFAGPATIAVLTDRLVSLREITLSEAGTDIEVPVDAAWGPGAYITITAYRPGEAREGRPGRALGLAWIGLDPAPRRLDVAITAPERIRPRQRVEIPIRIANARGEAMVTLAAVDEGILRLTGFASPDPLTHFLGKRALGVDIRDDY
ncbi:MAG: alpha-2-macroglobulin family protein, partial [Alphaproteobacteria bacterium]